jgi:hypothetical protein
MANPFLYNPSTFTAISCCIDQFRQFRLPELRYLASDGGLVPKVSLILFKSSLMSLLVPGWQLTTSSFFVGVRC